MNPFKEIDYKQNEALQAKLKQQAKEAEQAKRLYSCPYRKGGKALYSIHCHHPQRVPRSGEGPRQCLGFECPVVFPSA